MNFKTFFLTLLLACSISSLKAEEAVTAERILAHLKTAFGLPVYKDNKGLLACVMEVKDDLGKKGDVEYIASLACWTQNEKLSAQEREKLLAVLKYFNQEKPELIQETLDRNLEGASTSIIIVKALVSSGAKVHENFKDKNYNAIEKLEARIGLRKIDGIKSLNCESCQKKKFWFWEQENGDDLVARHYCKRLPEVLAFLKQAEKNEIAIEKANEIADAAEGN